MSEEWINWLLAIMVIGTFFLRKKKKKTTEQEESTVSEEETFQEEGTSFSESESQDSPIETKKSSTLSSSSNWQKRKLVTDEMSKHLQDDPNYKIREHKKKDFKKVHNLKNLRSGVLFKEILNRPYE